MVFVSYSKFDCGEGNNARANLKLRSFYTKGNDFFCLLVRNRFRNGFRLPRDYIKQIAYSTTCAAYLANMVSGNDLFLLNAFVCRFGGVGLWELMKVFHLESLSQI